MDFVSTFKEEGIARVVLSRGKVNALNDPVIADIRQSLDELEHDGDVAAVVLTGQGKFFSFGFDIPHFLSYSKEAFSGYLTRFTDLCSRLFLFPKPVVAALNGHTIAGGCMLAVACDYRIMAAGKAKISLNEITFGSSVFAGSAAMLKHAVGARNAELILTTGAMYSAEKAHRLGLVDAVADEESLPAEAKAVARSFAQKDAAAFRSIKKLLREPLAADIQKREAESIREFVDIWYSPGTWKNLQEIKIHA